MIITEKYYHDNDNEPTYKMVMMMKYSYKTMFIIIPLMTATLIIHVYTALSHIIPDPTYTYLSKLPQA